MRWFDPQHFSKQRAKASSPASTVVARYRTKTSKGYERRKNRLLSLAIQITIISQFNYLSRARDIRLDWKLILGNPLETDK